MSDNPFLDTLDAQQPDTGTTYEPNLGAAPKAPSGNPFLDTLDAQRDVQGRANLRQAITVNPDTFARDKRMAARAVLPVDVVSRNADEVKQQLAAQQFDTIKKYSPQLAARLASDPDFAKIAHDDVGHLAGIEKALTAGDVANYLVSKGDGRTLLGDTADLGHEVLKGLGGGFHKLGTGATVLAGAVPATYDFLTGGTAASDWWFSHAGLDDQNVFAPGQRLDEKAANAVGSMIGMLSQITLSGGGAAAELPASAGVGQTVAAAAEHGAKAMAVPALSDAVDTGRRAYAETGDGLAAARAATAQYAATTGMGVIPMSAPGNLAARALSGAATGVVTGEGSRLWMNANSPADMQQPSSIDDVILSAITGGMLGTMGPRGSTTAAVHDAVRQTYVDAARAEQTERDFSTLQTVSQLSAASKWRERDPEGFRQYLDTVTEDGHLANVYVEGRQFAEMLHQSGVTPDDLRAKMPEVAAQMNEGVQTDGFVRIPVADYATHIAGGALDASLLPHLRTDPDGMTFKESQDFFQQQAEGMKQAAEKLAGQQTEAQAWQQSHDRVQADIERQLGEAGRFTPEANRYQAAVQATIISRIADRLGITPEEAHQQFGARIVGSDIGAGLEQAAPSTLADATRRWQNELRQVSPRNMDYKPRLYTPAAISTMGVKDRMLSLSTRHLTRIKEDHPDVPESVFENLPALLHDPLYIIPHRDGGWRVVTDATTAKGEPIVVGVGDDGRIHTVTPIHDYKGRTGPEIMAEMVRGALSHATKMYARNDEALAKARASVLAPSGMLPMQRVSNSRLNIVNWDMLVKRHGEGFYQPDGWDTAETGAPDSPDPLKPGVGSRGIYSPATRTIALLRDANLSTFIHETGHWALDTYARLAADEKAPPEIRADMDKLLKWFGVESLDKWNAMSVDEQRPYHEQLARSFEAYFMEGKAPSQELQPVFARVKAWMVNVYKTIASLGGHLNDEVRGVFDRMLASEDAIREAQAARVFELPPAKPDHVSDADWATLQRLHDAATQDAVGEMQAKSLRDMKWLSNAKSKAMRALQREAASQRREMREQAAKEVDAEPVERARKWLRSGEMTDEHGAEVKAVKGYKLNSGDLKSMYPESSLVSPDLDALRGMTAKDGLHPDLVAEMFGLDSGDALVRELAHGDSRDTKIEALTDRYMLERHGELSTPAGIDEAASRAVHNEARARFLATGLKVLTKSEIPARQLLKGAKEAADAAIGAKRVRDVNPRQYEAAETRSNREMLKAVAKDPAAAVAAQRASLLNNQLVKSAQQALADVRKMIDLARKLDKAGIRGKIDVDIREQIDALLERFDFRQRPPEGPTRQQMQLQQWMDAQKALGYTPVEVPDMLDPALRMHFKDMTVEQVRGLHDTVRSLEMIGRERRMVTVDGQRVDVADLVDNSLVPKMKERGEKFTDAQLADRPRRGVDPLWRVTLDRLGSWLRSGLSELTRPDYKFNKYDLHEILGPFQKAINERLIGAAYRFGDLMDGIARVKRERTAEYGLDKEWQQTLDTVVDNHRLMDNSLEAPQKRRLTRGDLIGVALHVGNESNFDKLVKGMGWEPVDIWRALHDNLTAKDWNAARLMGELAGLKWDDMAAMNKRLGSDTPTKIEPRPFTTKFGEMPGWYMPVDYDPVRSRLGAKKAEERAVDPQKGLFGRDYFRADTTTNGSLNARQSGYHDFVDLDWRPVERRIGDTMRDLAYREAMIDVHKVYSNKAFRSQFMRTYGPEEYKHFGDWLGRLVNADIGDERQSKLTAIMSSSRRALVANGVAFRISTMLKHGASASAKSAGWFAGGGQKYFAKRIAQMSVNYGNEVTEALAKFPEIRQRLRQQDRDFSQTVQSIFEPESIHGKAERFGHAGVAWLDFLTAVPTAHAAYDWAITEGVPERLGGTGKPMSEADAIKFASKVVREAHGSTNEASQSLLINNKSEIVKGLTTLHGFMNNAFGQNADALDKLLHAKGFGKPELLARVMMSQIVPAIMAGWVTFGGPKEGENWLGWFFHHVGGEFAGMLPMVREAWAVGVEGFDSAGLPPWMRAVQDIGTAGVAVAKGEKAKQPVKKVGNAAGLLLPGLGQAGATSQFLYDIHKGEQHPETVGEWLKGLMTGNEK